MSGNLTNYSSPNLVIPFSMPSDTPEALKPVIKPIYTAFTNIVQSLIYYCGIGPRPPGTILSSAGDPTALLANNVHRFYVQASETITQYAAINLWGNAGSLFARNANATDGTKPCDGFCSQSGGIPNGSIGEVILSDGMIIGLAGLTVGTRYYLSTTAGVFTTIPPTASGNLQQSIGIAISAAALRFIAGPQIQH